MSGKPSPSMSATFMETVSPRISNGVSAWKSVDVPRTTCKKPLGVAVGSPV